MKYKCLVFDHDDTVVNSTATIHYPCFQEYLDLRYPGKHMTLDEYFLRNFAPGFIEMCKEDFGMTDADLDDEVVFWGNYVKEHIPLAYDGIREIMEKQKAEGGLICVVSHSFAENIIRDYEYNRLPKPDCIFGWEQPPEKRKPSPFPLEEIMRLYNLDSGDLLMIDDLKPGYDMAKSCGVDFVGVGWSNDIPQIESFMRANCPNYFKKVEELKAFLED